MKQFLWALISCLAVFFTNAARADDTLHPVALTGDPAPGYDFDLDFSNFNYGFQLNNRGQVLFHSYARKSAPLPTSRYGAWLYDPIAGLKLIAGEQTPVNALDAGSLGETHLNNSGQVSVLGYHAGVHHVWLITPGSAPRIVGRQNDPVPDPGSALLLREIMNPAVNDAGQVTFNSNFIRPGEFQPDDEGTILVESDGIARVLKPRQNDPVPGAEPGVTFTYASWVDAAFTNSAGQRIVRGVLGGPGVDFNNQNGYWLSDDDGSVSYIARDGDPAPGMPAGVVYGPAAFIGAYGSVGLNSNGHVSYTAYVVGPGVTTANNYGVWSNREGPMELLYRTGDSVPGSANTVFTYFQNPVLNDSGQLAFGATVNGGPSVGQWTGLWAENSQGELQLIQRNGVPAPGIASNFSLMTVTFNAHGQLALFGNANSLGDEEGLWATNLAGELVHIAHSGGTLDVDPGPGVHWKTVKDILFYGGTGNGDGRSSMFNDRGELAFFASFTDGTEGVFISTAVSHAIPEPATAALALFVFAFTLSARHRVDCRNPHDGHQHQRRTA